MCGKNTPRCVWFFGLLLTLTAAVAESGEKNRRLNHMYPSQSCDALILAGRNVTAVLPL